MGSDLSRASFNGGNLNPQQPQVPGLGGQWRRFEPDPNRFRNGANNSIAVFWNGLGGAPGRSTAPAGPEGLVEIAGGYYRQYESGRIYTKRNVGTFWLHGPIGDRYAQLNGPAGWLGWPTSDDQDFDGGRVRSFENGAIYWWSDTGAIELGNVIVRYKGLVCFGETDSDQSSGADEPYCVFGVVPAIPGLAGTQRTSVYEDVDAGDSREDSLDLYVGPPYGLMIATTCMEHDFGDPAKAQEAAQKGVDEAAEIIEAVVAYVPVVGPVLAKLVGPLFDEIGDDLAEAVSDLLGLGDDTIGTVPLHLSPKQLVTLTRAPEQEFKGIRYRAQTELISGHGASYKAFFDVQPA